MSAEKHRTVQWKDLFDCDYHSTKTPDFLTVGDLNYARKRVHALAGLNPEAVPLMLEALEAFQIWDVSQQTGEDNSSEEAEQRIFDSYQRAANLMRTALAEIKKAGE